jgi:hypothetical protein
MHGFVHLIKKTNHPIKIWQKISTDTLSKMTHRKGKQVLEYVLHLLGTGKMQIKITMKIFTQVLEWLK